tara:strand:- start:328 stop:1542 length:1215 start_codon:yes stop_codon:yes gene_type:complete
MEDKSMSVTKLKVQTAYSSKHPVHKEITKHYFTVRAKDLPAGIPTGANARTPNGLNRRVYREVKESLLGRDGSVDGTFDLMNRGIICLANKVRRIDSHTYEIHCNDDEGIADGAHTYAIICGAQGEALPDEQYVEFQVRTGVCQTLRVDMSRGLNTGIQVKAHSLANLDGKYNWLKAELANEPYFDLIAWNESDRGSIDVREIICVLEALNIFVYPNDCSRHPVHAYEKISTAAIKFSEDFELHKDNLDESIYYRLRPLLRDALGLYDHIRHDFRDVYNSASIGRAGALDIIEQRKGKGRYDFPFANLPAKQHRLTKGAFYPIFAAFRNKVTVNKTTNQAQWQGGFNSVMELWRSVNIETARQTKNAIQIYGPKPDQIGKARGHWTTMHQAIELHILRSKGGEG